MWDVVRGRSIHDVDPDRQRELTAEGAAINFLRFVEPRPDHAGQGGVVAGEKRIGEIVGGAGLARGGEFFQTIFFVGGLPSAFGQAHRQAGVTS